MLQIISIRQADNGVFYETHIRAATEAECTVKKDTYYSGYLCANCRKHFNNLTRCMDHTRSCYFSNRAMLNVS